MSAVVAKSRIAVRRFAGEDAGSLTIFALFMFILILFISGMAVDMIRHENDRVAMQNALDSAVLAATSINQESSPDVVIAEYLTKAGLDPSRVTVDYTEHQAGGITIGREVIASSNVSTNTMFMNMMGVDSLNGPSSTMALEGADNIEISLVLDISSSMGSNNRIENLKIAATEFVQTLYSGDSAARISVSIVPYFGGVVVGDEILSRLNASGTIEPINGGSPHNGALTEYPTEHNDSTCVRFVPEDYLNPSIGPQTPLRRVSNFERGNNNFETPSVGDRWCKEDRPSILTHETDLAALETYIDDMVLGVYTGGHIGMKWGVALLDPAFRPVVDGMVDDGVLPEEVRGRPGNYDNTKVKKIIVLMTDGAMTTERDLEDEFKSGPSRIWYSESRTSGTDAGLGREQTEFDGYFVEMPQGPATQRWYVPGSPHTTSDDDYHAQNDLPADAVQLDYHELHRRFAEDDIAEFFFEHSDSDAYDDHRNAAYTVVSGSGIDNLLWDMCDTAKNGGIDVYAIGFEAPDRGVTAMQNCASTPGHFFDVEGTQISEAFQSIAAQITLLRLIQ